MGLAISFLVLCFSLLPTQALAQQAGLIEAGDQDLRDDLQWLIDRNIIDISVSTWPLPVAALEKALENRKKTNLTRADINAILAVRHYLDDRQKAFYGVVAQVNSDSIPQLGFANQSLSAATLGGFVQGGTDTFAGRLQVNGLIDPITPKQSNANLSGSYVSALFLGQMVYFGQISHYWGPGQTGSLNWGNAATPIPGVGLQRAQQTAPQSKWLSWIGPWGYDIFMGQLQHDTAVPAARVFNTRLFFRPIAGLELGASRLVEWGGDGRRNGIGAWWDGVFGNSNVTGGAYDPSNELAGFDARYTFPLWGNPMTLYAQFTGEDEAGGLPSHYLSQVGAQFKHQIGGTRLQWYAEATDTMAERVFGLGAGYLGMSYNHGVYKNGLYEDGLPIAYPIGGSGREIAAGVTIIPDDFRYFSRYSIQLLHTEVNPESEIVNQAFPYKAKFYGAELGYSWRIRPATFHAGITVLRRIEGNFDNAFSFMLSMSVPLGGH